MSFQNFCSEQGFSSRKKVFFSPHIPDKIINNAKTSFGLSSESNEILAAVDNTVFGSGKDGCLILVDRIIFKQPFEDLREHFFSGISSIVSDGQTVFLNGRKVFKFHMPEKEDLIEFFQLFGAWISNSGVESEYTQNDEGGSINLQKPTDSWVSSLAKQELDIDHRAIYCAPSIPVKKISGALSSYGNWVDSEDVIVLIDDTAFGGAKEGVLITEEKIAMKAMMDSPRLFFWKNIQKISIQKKKIFINGRGVISLAQLGEKELGAFFYEINKLLPLRDAEHQDHAQDVSKNSQAGLRDDKAIVDSDPSHSNKEKRNAVQLGKAVRAPQEKNKCKEVNEEEEIILEANEAEQSSDNNGKGKLSEYAAQAIEANWSRISPFLLEKTGEASLDALNNDENIERLGSVIYTLLPSVVRFAIREDVFIKFLLDNRNKIIGDKLKAFVESKKSESGAPRDLLEKQAAFNSSIFAAEFEKAKRHMRNGFSSHGVGFSKEQFAKKKADYLFYMKVMEVALEFPSFASEKISDTITREEASALASDEAIITTLGYIIASTSYMLEFQAGFNQDQVQSVLEPVFSLAILPYAEQAAKGKPKTLKSFSSSEARIQEIPELARIKKVAHVLMQNIGNKDMRSLCGNYTNFITSATEHAFDSKDAQLNFFSKMWKLGDGDVEEYLNKVDENLEEGLIDYLSALQGL
ncbi:hypothetical protein ACUN9Y_12420 [Halomonas sp. V046]|uniref:hypothetical protein n=1 Tax=Halomonas sp. V046 TaxID=3459611 RepID=UPI004043C3CC